MPHHVDRFGAALSVLVEEGPIKNRLITAYEEQLSNIAAERLPKTLRKPFETLRSRMTAVAPLNGEGPIRASVRKMSVQDATECASLILGMYTELLQSGAVPASAGAEDGQGAKPRNGSRNVPAMLLKSV